MTPHEQFQHIQQHHEVYQDLVQQGYLEPVEAYDLVCKLSKKYSTQNGVPEYWTEYMPCSLRTKARS